MTLDIPAEPSMPFVLAGAVLLHVPKELSHGFKVSHGGAKFQIRKISKIITKLDWYNLDAGFTGGC